MSKSMKIFEFKKKVAKEQNNIWNRIKCLNSNKNNWIQINLC